jgi:hypothetical protein
MAALATTSQTWVFDDRSESAATTARTRSHHLAEDRLPNATDLSRPSAFGACDRTAADIGTRALAVRARHCCPNRYWSFATKDRIRELEVHYGFDVGSARRATRRPATERRTPIEKHVEDVAKPTTAERRTTLHPSLTVHVVLLPALRI